MKKPKRIPPEERPALLDRVRHLNAQGRNDVEIGLLLGFSSTTIAHWRGEADPPIPAAPRPIVPANTGYQYERQCPVCTQPIDVVRGLIEPHKALLGRVGRGEIHGMPVAVADDCPASGRVYARFVAAGLMTA